MYEKLPEQLKKDGRFCLWKYEERNGRMTKVPYQTNGRKASSADKNTFSDFRLAVNAMDGYDGIGMGAFDDFCMVDIDHCVLGGKMTQMAEDIVERMDSYPVLRWMAGNVVIETDAAENIKVTKAKSKEKIDGIVASIMALDRCIRNQGETQGSVYDERGLLVF